MKKHLLLLPFIFLNSSLSFGMHNEYHEPSAQPVEIPTIAQIKDQTEAVQTIFEKRNGNLVLLVDAANELENMINIRKKYANLSEEDQVIIMKGKSLLEYIDQVTNKEAHDYIEKIELSQKKKQLEKKQPVTNQQPKKTNGRGRYFTQKNILTAIGLSAVAFLTYLLYNRKPLTVVYKPI